MQRRTMIKLLAGAVGIICAVALVQAVWLGVRGKRCSDFASQQDAQAYYAGLDPFGSHPLDEDADGTACEELAPRAPTREEIAAEWCARSPEAPAPIAFLGSVRAVADDTEYYRRVTFDVAHWFTIDRGAEVTLAVFVNWSRPIGLDDEWLVATADSPDPGDLNEMFVCASEPLTDDARRRWDQRYATG